MTSQNKTISYSNPGEYQIDKEKLASMSYSKKIEHLKTLRIYHNSMKKIFEDIDECKNSADYIQAPTCMCLVGPSGSGKTTFYEMYSNKYPTVKCQNGVEKPVLYCEIPCPARIGSLAPKLLEALGDPFYGNRINITLQTQRLYYLLKECKVKVIFLDEIQHLVDRNSNILIRDSSDWFKKLINETKISLIFMGMPESQKIFIENDQLLSRVRLYNLIKPFQHDDIFRTLLYMFDVNLPLKSISGLANNDMSKRILIATKGLIRNISILIRESTILAIQSNANKVDITMLAYVYDKYFPMYFDKNPFLTEYDIDKGFDKYTRQYIL